MFIFFKKMFQNKPEFKSFSKISRYNREIIVTEKIDGTNGQIYINEWGDIYAMSRNRILDTKTKATDNYGFCRWVMGNKKELLKLGEGRHYGEWYGQGIARNYGLKEKRFALFDVVRYKDIQTKIPFLGTVPILYWGLFEDFNISNCIKTLKEHGSYLVPGFIKPEGIVLYHTHGNFLLKKTIEDDDVPKKLTQK